MQQQQQPSGGPPGDGGGSAGGGLPFGPGGGGGGGGGYLQQFQAQQALAEELQKFWEAMKAEVEEHSELLTDFKTQALPLARIKKVGGAKGVGAGARARTCMAGVQRLHLRRAAHARGATSSPLSIATHSHPALPPPPQSPPPHTHRS